ncbi:MAG: 2-oxoacid:ferredoxin oxidoreductase subunit beta [Candidatus Aenigmatarchaeota archaeon]
MMDSAKTIPTWCPGCGNWAILAALKGALAELELAPHSVLVVGGVGCHGHLPQWLTACGFQTIHGRTLPLAQAAKLANHELTVIASAGDGDCYAIGLGHLIHACRRNIDITLLVHNNGVFGLTAGQTSPTSPKGFRSKSTPFGSPNTPINPLSLALDAGATFVARSFAGDPTHLQSIIARAIRHKGFALVDILQPCVVWNRSNTYEFWRQSTYKLEATSHNPASFDAAAKKARETNPWPLGILYQAKAQSLTDHLPQIARQPLVKQPIGKANIGPLLEEYR